MNSESINIKIYYFLFSLSIIVYSLPFINRIVEFDIYNTMSVLMCVALSFTFGRYLRTDAGFLSIIILLTSQSFFNTPIESSFFSKITTLSFFPWSILAFFSIFNRLKRIILNKFRLTESFDFLTLIIFVLISLGYYFDLISDEKSFLFITPLISSLILSEIWNLSKNNEIKTLIFLEKVQLLTIGILLFFGIGLNAILFPINSMLLICIAPILISLIFFFVLKSSSYGFFYKLIIPVSIASIIFNFFLQTNVYMSLKDSNTEYKTFLFNNNER